MKGECMWRHKNTHQTRKQLSDVDVQDLNEIGFSMSQKYLKSEIDQPKSLSVPIYLSQFKETAIKEEGKIDWAFAFTLEGIHGQIECLVGWEDEGEEEKEIRNQHGTPKDNETAQLPNRARKCKAHLWCLCFSWPNMDNRGASSPIKCTHIY